MGDENETREEVIWRNGLWERFIKEELKRKPEPGDFPEVSERFRKFCAKHPFPKDQ